MGKEKENSTEQQPLLYIAQSKRSQLVGNMQKVFIIKQNPSEQYQLDVNQENKGESLSNIPSSKVESEEIETEGEEKPCSAEEESVSVDNKKVEEKEKLCSAKEESVSVDNELEIEKEVEEKKVFAQMTNVEKINYVLNRPHYIPNIQCAIQTKEEVYVGYIISFEKEVLKMKSGTQFNFVTIALADIETIRMKGLA
ncbi:CotO family spore coat protein [Bacillus sp. NPDC094106]|uniref:CotO family spore coat protein n=1 Tax=Bacillus sp. NPDC094106 TaxID=3363949 RepID=UPI003830F1B6